ncbi:hypothetical protein [Lacrimispora saccharolytica]|uniref:Uncharacterized protein n=1 Tax=Lacrimispora saccharolytica (strain ATCC 35040 / DSM 2544 / NRCC 2533 / WM1) TaxID=610130 RepID=D9R3U1_LACSW|nr:hypothetical protein [Lacrimispora saccharolytica]ADL03054.1 hypothetical protein Closa_0417 [[Clostridium] saccharolyticum WM1]
MGIIIFMFGVTLLALLVFFFHRVLLVNPEHKEWNDIEQKE